MTTVTPINLEYLNQISEGDQEFESELLSLFIDDAKQHIQAAEAAIEVGDFKTLEREAHHLKGSSGNVGAQFMQSIAYDLEQEALHLSADGVVNKIHQLKTSLEAVIKFAEPIIN